MFCSGLIKFTDQITIMNYQGVLRKMQTELGEPIQYYLVFESDFLNVNQVFSHVIRLA